MKCSHVPLIKSTKCPPQSDKTKIPELFLFFAKTKLFRLPPNHKFDLQTNTQLC